MINCNLILYDLLDKTIDIDFFGNNFIVNYNESDLIELTRVLNSKVTKYPMIWLESGYKMVEPVNRGNKTLLLQGCRFFLITKGSQTDYPKTRFSTTYNELLYTLKEKFIDKIRKSKGISISGTNFTSKSLPFNSVSEVLTRYGSNNYDNDRERDNISTDIWDAIVIECDLLIKTNCYL